MRTRPELTMDDCALISAAALTEAMQHGWNVSIAILDSGAHLLHLVRMDGASPASADISQRKAHTAAMTRRPSKSYEDRIAAGRLAVMSMPPDPTQGS